MACEMWKRMVNQWRADCCLSFDIPANRSHGECL
jgi:hypothetical protein